MERLWVAAVSAGLLIGVGAARAAGPEDELKAIEAQWTQAYVKQDVSALEKIVATDWRGQDAKGVRDRAAMLKQVTSPKETTTSAVLHDVHVRVMGDAAVAQGMEDDKGMRKGKPYAETIAWTDVFQKRDGHWMAVASQNTVLKGK